MSNLQFTGDAVKAIEQLGVMLDGFKSVLLLRAAAKMNLFDIIETYSGSGVSTAQLSTDQGMNADKLERVMNALVSVKALNKISDKQQGVSVYSNTNMGHLLTNDGGFKEFVMASLDEAAGFDLVASDITKPYPTDADKQAVNTDKQDKPDAKQHQDEDQPDVSTIDINDPECLYKGFMLIDRWAKAYAKQLIEAIDLTDCTSMVDLGCGSGVYSFEAARLHSNLTVTLMDMPPVIDCVKQYFMPKDENLKINCVAGNFLEVDIPSADVYFLSNVIHYFEKEAITELMNKIGKVAKSSSRVVILDKCLGESKTGPVSAALWDVSMLPQYPSRARTQAEYKALLQPTDFKNVSVMCYNSECVYDIIIASK